MQDGVEGKTARLQSTLLFAWAALAFALLNYGADRGYAEALGRAELARILATPAGGPEELGP